MTSQNDENKSILIAEVKSLVDIKTPKKYILQRQGAGGKVFSYVETGYVIKTLNEKFNIKGIPLWDFKITDHTVGKKQIWVKGQLTIHLSDNLTITKEQFGGVDIKFHVEWKNGVKVTNYEKPLSIADDLKAAGSDALKKCASLLGIASDIYWKGDSEAEEETTLASFDKPIDNTNGVVMASVKQTNYIAILCKQKGQDRDKLKEQYHVKSSKELTLAQAKEIIDKLIKLPDVLPIPTTSKQVNY